jgi:hypothetical protein
MKQNLERRIKGFIPAGIMASMFLFNDISPLPIKPQELNASPATTMQNSAEYGSQEQFEFKKLKRKEEEKKKSSQAKTESHVTDKKYVLSPVNVDVFDNQGNLYHQYSNIKFDQSLGQKNQTTIEIPQGGSIKLNGMPVIDDFVTDMMFYDSQGKKLLTQAAEAVDLEDEFPQPGYIGTLSFQLEKGDYIPPKGSMRVPFRVVESPSPVVTLAPPYVRETPTKETEIARRMLDKEAGKMVPEKPRRHHGQGQSGESLFSFKVVYVQGNTLSLIEDDTETADKTGKGWVFEGLFAKPNYQVWVNHLRYTDDCRLPVFGGNLRHVTSQFDVGIEAKVLGIIALGGEFFNYDLKWETDWPDTTRTWSPDMEKYQSNGFKVGAGLILGEYNKSFVEGLVYYGKGKAIESKINPSLEYYGEYITDTENFTEKSLKIHARAELGPFLLKGNYIKGRYDNSAKTLDGNRTMYNADALLNLSKLVPKLGQGKMDINAGLFYHHIEASEVGLELFEHELYGPIVIMDFKW